MVLVVTIVFVVLALEFVFEGCLYLVLELTNLGLLKILWRLLLDLWVRWRDEVVSSNAAAKSLDYISRPLRGMLQVVYVKKEL